MVTLTLTLTDEEFDRIAAAALQRGQPIEELVRDTALSAAVAADGRQTFEEMARRGDVAAALDVLDRLDARFGTDSRAAAGKG